MYNVKGIFNNKITSIIDILLRNANQPAFNYCGGEQFIVFINNYCNCIFKLLVQKLVNYLYLNRSEKVGDNGWDPSWNFNA